MRWPVPMAADRPVLSPNPYFVAEKGPWEDFLSVYDPQVTPFVPVFGDRTVLFGALANQDPGLRERIANRLLDDGADPSIVAGQLTVLHVLLSRRKQDPESTVRLLRRLVQGGADINKTDPKEGAPLWMCWKLRMAEDEIVPMFEIFLSRPDLDLDRPANKFKSVREMILAATGSAGQRLRQMVVEFIEKQEAQS